MLTDTAWAAFADLNDDEQCHEAIHSHLTRLAGCPAADLDSGVQALLRAEDGRSSIAHRRLVLGRFRAWLTMPPESVTALAGSIETARAAIGRPAAMASVAADQRAGRELTADEVTRLLTLLPMLRDHMPKGVGPALDESTAVPSGPDQLAPSS